MVVTLHFLNTYPPQNVCGNCKRINFFYRSSARVVTEEANRFIADCLRAAGANQEAAEQQAKLLIEAEKLGHPSHGMNRLGMYMKLEDISIYKLTK